MYHFIGHPLSYVRLVRITYHIRRHLPYLRPRLLYMSQYILHACSVSPFLVGMFHSIEDLHLVVKYSSFILSTVIPVELQYW